MDNPVKFRDKLYQIIFEHDTRVGRAFDIMLIGVILLSVMVVILDSVQAISYAYRDWFLAAEWTFTVLFTIEYILRLYSSPRPLRYARSFYGLIDLGAVLPTYLSLVFPPSRFLITVRVLRVLRVFRVLKMARYLGEAGTLYEALKTSRYKISVFLATVLAIVIIVGSVMYTIEGEEAGFTSIPKGIYWAIVTLTTVGYGDIAPQTPLGQALAAFLMITGYGIIAVPTGIVTVELGMAARSSAQRMTCLSCQRKGHDSEAAYCKYCGGRLSSETG